jgi:hypothetical protein
MIEYNSSALEDALARRRSPPLAAGTRSFELSIDHLGNRARYPPTINHGRPHPLEGDCALVLGCVPGQTKRPQSQRLFALCVSFGLALDHDLADIRICSMAHLERQLG